MITVQTKINGSINKVWEFWTKPEHITKWAFASDDWEAPEAENDVRVGGRFKTVMSAKDKSTSFDFTGVYTSVLKNKLIEYDMDDGRHVRVEFFDLSDGVDVIETFETEKENTEEKQREGWQAILDNFKKHVENFSN
ncbi:MAG: SRPBCC domain-containing protein [Candidatus Magasanikiibacteriota bacterium]